MLIPSHKHLLNKWDYKTSQIAQNGGNTSTKTIHVNYNCIISQNKISLLKHKYYQWNS